MYTSKIKEILPKINIDHTDNNSLYSGDSGIILFGLLNDLNLNNLDTDIENILVYQSNLTSISSGRAGINWLFTYMHRELKILDLNVLNSICQDDEYLKKVSLDQLNIGFYDLIVGALGISYYLLYDSEAIDIKYHSEVVNSLSRLYELNGTFYYKQSSMDFEVKMTSLGFAHGLPGIIRYLAECYKYRIEEKKVADLINSILNEFLSYKNQNTTYGAFPLAIFPGKERKNTISRLAWCYGDAGLGIGLYNSAKIIGNKDLMNEMKAILLKSTERKDPKNTLIHDAGFCHGSSGIAYIYYKMWHETKEPEFHEAAYYWLEKTISFGQLIDGKYEFKTCKAKNEYKLNRDFLEGNAGVGIVLYSFLTNDFSWDYCMMLND